jgi:hypothetical protein
MKVMTWVMCLLMCNNINRPNYALVLTVHVISLLACFTFLHIFICVSLIVVICSLLTNFHEI